MAAYDKILLNGQPVDLFQGNDTKFLINRLVQDLQGNTRGDFSTQNLTLPRTKNNSSIISGVGVLMNCIVIVGGLQVFIGKAQLKRVNHQLKPYGLIEIKSYELEITSSNSSWIQQLQNTTLSELTNEIVLWNPSNIETGLTTDPDVREWAFAFIKFKQWENDNGQTGTDFRYTPSLFEATPVLYIRPLVNALFAKAGYKLISIWLNEQITERLVIDIPLPERTPQAYNVAYLNAKASSNGFNFINTVSAGTGRFPADIGDVQPPNNLGAYDTFNFYYTAPLTGYYELKVSATFGTTPPPEPAYFWLLQAVINGTVTNPQTQIGFSQGNAPTIPNKPYPAGQTISASVVVFANAGDQLAWEYLTFGTIEMTKGVLEFNGEAIKQQNMDIDFQYFLTEDLGLDLLRGLKAKFNLVFYTDENTKSVYMEPADGHTEINLLGSNTAYRQGFYSENIKDYSSIIDLSKRSQEDYTLSPKVRKFKCTFDQDPTAEYIQEGSDFQIYEARYVSDLEATEGEVDTVVVPFFAACLHVLDSETQHPDSAKIPQFALVYNQNYVLEPNSTEANHGSKRRLLYHAGIRTGEEDGFMTILELGKTPVPATFMVDYNADDPSISPNLGFADFATGAGVSQGLMKRYYLQTLARTEAASIRDSFVFFNQVDNINFRFQLKAYIEGVKYIIQQIKSFDPSSSSSTNFLFLEDVPITEQVVNKKQDSLLNPIVSTLSTI